MRLSLFVLAAFGVAAAMFAPCALAQDEAPVADIDPKVKEILDSVAQFYTALDSFSVVNTYSSNIKRGDETETFSATGDVAMQRPNKLATIPKKGEGPPVEMISDGKNLYVTFPEEGVYVKEEAPESFEDVLGMPWAQMFIFPLFLMSEDPTSLILEDVTKGTYVGEVELDGVAHHQLRFAQSGMTWDMWVQKGERPLVTRVSPDVGSIAEANGEEATGETNFLFTNWQTDAALPADRFAFDAPAGLRETTFEELMGAGEETPASDLLGKPAPDFTLELLDGTKKTLSSHKDKDIVVLDFWATWCGPCRQAMPEIIGATSAMKKDNVVLYAVNQGEEPAQITEFLKSEKLDATVALDPEGEIASFYKVQGIPQTVIIGKDGTVQAVHVGFMQGLKQQLTKQLETLASGGNLVDGASAKVN